MRCFKRLVFSFIFLVKYTIGRVKPYYQFSATKSKFSVLRDLLAWYFREGRINMNYYMQGLNEKGTSIDDFIGKREFQKIQKKAATTLKLRTMHNHLSFDLVTKDKFYCGSILKANGIPTFEPLLLIIGKSVIALEEGLGNSLAYLKSGDYFFKNVIKESGEGILGFQIKDDLVIIKGKVYSVEEAINALKGGVWIVQPRYVSHKAIQLVNSSALNTTRIYTILGFNGIYYLGGYQAFATDEAPIDSWQFGSVYVAIDPEKELLKPYGITSISDRREGVLYEHPNSKIVFDGYKLPGLKQAVDLCKRAHGFFYGVFVIGWDIALTNEGPIVVEVNERPGINVLQSLDGGVRNRILREYKELKNANR